MQPAPAGCKEQHILRERYRADLKVYIDATARLGPCAREDFERAFRHAERARLAFENARSALNSHISNHGCDYQPQRLSTPLPKPGEIA
jgi:hypothetical protein